MNQKDPISLHARIAMAVCIGCSIAVIANIWPTRAAGLLTFAIVSGLYAAVLMRPDRSNHDGE